MSVLAFHWTVSLTVTNVALAALCFAAILTVLIAVVFDVLKSRHRIVIPDVWPPDGVDLLEP